MQKLAARAIEREPVSPICRRLVVAAVDRQSREVTIEQGSGAPMTDDGQVIVGGLRHDLLDGANNPRLGYDRRLPASDALLGVSEERVGRRLELLLCKVPRRRSVILAEVVDDAVSVEPERVREDLCPVARLLLVLEKMRRTPLAQGQAAIISMRARPRSLSGQSGTGTLASIAT